MAGDVLHRWNEPAELVNFLIVHMPHVYAVAGNHDLPNHDLGQIKRSAYWTLKEAGKITDMTMGANTLGRIQAHGFGCGVKVRPRKEGQTGLGLAVIHDLCYEAKPFPGVDPAKQCCEWVDRVYGYNTLHFGDNHTPVHFNRTGVEVFGAGTFMRRRANERGHKPRVGILHTDGLVTKKFLDTSADKWDEGLTGSEADAAGVDVAAFEEAALKVGSAGVDFAQAVRQYARKNKSRLDKATRDLLVEILEEAAGE